PSLDCRRIRAMAPIARHEFDLDAPAHRHVLPEGGKVASFDHQHLVARRERVDDRCLPRTGSRGGKDDDRAGSLKDLLTSPENSLGQFAELHAAVVDDRHVHRAEHPVWHRAWAWNLQKMTSLVLHPGLLCGSWQIIAFNLQAIKNIIVYNI